MFNLGAGKLSILVPNKLSRSAPWNWIRMLYNNDRQYSILVGIGGFISSEQKICLSILILKRVRVFPNKSIAVGVSQSIGPSPWSYTKPEPTAAVSRSLSVAPGGTRQ